MNILLPATEMRRLSAINQLEKENLEYEQGMDILIEAIQQIAEDGEYSVFICVPYYREAYEFIQKHGAILTNLGYTVTNHEMYYKVSWE